MKFGLSAVVAVVGFLGNGGAGFLVTPSLSPVRHRSQRYAVSGTTGTGEGWLDNPAAPVDSHDSARNALERALQGADSFHKSLALLGSTGSIGTQTLDIVDVCPSNFDVIGLSAGTNVDLLSEQVLKFKPRIVSVATTDAAERLKEKLVAAGCSPLPEIGVGIEGMVAVATAAEVDTVVTGIVGAAGLTPTVEAIKAGKDIALANKETLISGGPIINPLVAKHGIKMIPADSEHSAIFQCLQGVPEGALRRVILTASGGAFRDYSTEELLRLCDEDPRFIQQKATTHPNWDMGAKITLDSATMMNKGLEVIEAHYLFGASYDDIDVVIHPQSIVHSMIETKDTSCLAQLGWADMRLPLVYSVSWPHRLNMPYRPLDLAELAQLTFKRPDRVKYPCIDLAYAAGRAGGTMTAVLNAANEAANQKFRDDVGLNFMDIPRVIESVMEAHKSDMKPSSEITLDDIFQVDAWARAMVEEKCVNLEKNPVVHVA